FRKVAALHSGEDLEGFPFLRGPGRAERVDCPLQDVSGLRQGGHVLVQQSFKQGDDDQAARYARCNVLGASIAQRDLPFLPLMPGLEYLWRGESSTLRLRPGRSLLSCPATRAARY